MTDSIQLDDTSRSFLLALHEATHGDTSVQISMYEIGETIGIDKSQAARAAEELLGWELAEVRTLSGDIGITAAGIEAARGRTGGTGQGEDIGLGDAPVLEDAARETVDQILTQLKENTGKIGLDFDAIGTVMADIKTVEAQLASPKPKTDIFRSCFKSIREELTVSGAEELAGRIDKILGH